MGDGRTSSYLETHPSGFCNLTSFFLAQRGCHTSRCPTHTGSQTKPMARWEYIPCWGTVVPQSKGLSDGRGQEPFHYVTKTNVEALSQCQTSTNGHWAHDHNQSLRLGWLWGSEM